MAEDADADASDGDKSFILDLGLGGKGRVADIMGQIWTTGSGSLFFGRKRIKKYCTILYMNTNYECVYNVGLLDDLHNYFPAFLYDSGRFQTPVQVFHYMRSELNSRFNLNAYGARLAGYSQHEPIQRVPIPIPAATAPVPVPVPAPATFSTPIQRSRDSVAAVVAGLLDLSGNFLADGSYFFMHPSPRIPPPPNFLDAVIVRPSEEVLARNTIILLGSDLGEESSCAICQDVIAGTDTCRKLSCSHAFHQTCIDQWFQTNVNCPTCRHDIRVE